MRKEEDNYGIITHDFPVWRERANFIISIDLVGDDVPDKWKREQLWARETGDNIFELCCIPFFAYGLALGDYVETKPKGAKRFLVDKVLKPKGHTTFRIWFLDLRKWALVIEEIQTLGCFVEIRWDKSQLIAVDAPTIEKRASLESYMSGLQADGTATYELAS